MADYTLTIEHNGWCSWVAYVRSEYGGLITARVAFTRWGAIRRGRRYIRLHKVERVDV